MTYYGEAEVRGKDTVLWVLMGPNSAPVIRAPDGETQVLMKPEKQEFKLVIKGWAIPVPGTAVVGTKHWVVMDREEYMNQRLKDAHVVAAQPEIAIRIDYDPDDSSGGTWQGVITGEWPVKLIRVRRKSRWDVMRGRLGPGRRAPRG